MKRLLFSGLGMSYFSFCQYKFKINAVITLLNRVYKLCSNFELFHLEIEFLCKFFINNGFPDTFFTLLVRKFFNIQFINKLSVLTVPKPEKFQMLINITWPPFTLRASTRTFLWMKQLILFWIISSNFRIHFFALPGTY